MSDSATTIRADLHNHTHYSKDSILSPEYLLRRARERRISVIAVTDHDSIRGGVATRELARVRYPDVRVIVGEEVRSRDGEVLGLFLEEAVPPGLSAAETVECIHAQGGLAGAPHPYDSFRSGLNEDVLEDLAVKLDFIEGFNARMTLSSHNDKAVEFAAKRGLPMSAASDAHSPREIGRAYVRMPDFAANKDFLDSLRAGRMKGRLSSPLIHLVSRYATIRSRLGWRPR
jgi:predicted metal-dependent phosphoesterase TrpH